MPLWLQHLVVLALVATCLGYVIYQGVRSFRGKGSGIGKCCAKGCAPTSGDVQKLHFLPVEMLRKRPQQKSS